jgi:predicted AAA+ superfamily ATPase
MKSRSGRSRKPSAANSTAAKRLESTVFYLDESIYSRALYQRMVNLGARVERAGEAFPFGAQDAVWLAGCGQRGWVALTRDRNIRRRALERRAIRESGAAVSVGTVPNQPTLHSQSAVAGFPISRYAHGMRTYPRHAEKRVSAALRDTRVVALSGPRQSGKTTLARRFAHGGRVYLTLDDRATLAAASSDPVAFIRGIERAVIDEVQRVPEILLAIKRSVDEDKRPGRFLLTGSANLLTLAAVRESLAGRVESIPLYPLSQSELRRSAPPKFIDHVFAGRIPRARSAVEDSDLIRLVSSGGYPEALTRRTERRRQDWYRSYLEAIAERDVPDVAAITRPGQLPRLLQITAQYASRLTNLSEIGRSVGLDHKTTDSYLRVLEQLFLLRRVQPWSRNELSRVVKTPKLHFLDAGLLAAMRGYSLKRLQADRISFGPVLETFVYSELLKIASWSNEYVSIYHYRDRDQNEVDFVLENAAGAIVGIEVKAAASVTRRDFQGLDRLASIAGAAFVQGIIFYDGAQSLSFADTLHAAPLTALWAR